MILIIEIYFFVYIRGKYARKVDMNTLNSKRFEGHPFFVWNKLYFTKEVNGQWDIYSAKYDNLLWNEIKPLGDIYTNEDEAFNSEMGNKSFF